VAHDSTSGAAGAVRGAAEVGRGAARLDSGQIASGVRGVFVLVEKSIIIAYCEGTRLRHCARSRKVARSMPDGVINKVLSTAMWSCGWLRLQQK